MQSQCEAGVESKTPYKHFMEAAYAVPLRYGVRAPRIPGPEQHAPAWEVPEELAMPKRSRKLRQIYRFKDLGQDLQLACHQYFEGVSPDLMIDWNKEESRNIRLPAHSIRDPIQERDVDDLRSFRRAIYDPLIVTAMEMARLLYGSPYQESYRYSREATVNLVRGARWDVLPYAQTESAPKPDGTQVSRGPEQPKEPKMVVICIPPWDLSSLDLQDFASQRTLAAGELDLTPGEMKTSKAHVLWAIVYEACKNARCSYFIVSTYNHWVFGNMNKNYATASVSSVFDFSEKSGMYQRPNLLQLITYWELSSIDAANWDIPLGEDVANRG